MSWSTAAVATTFTLPETLPLLAVIAALPGAAACARPMEAESLLTATTEVFEEDQVHLARQILHRVIGKHTGRGELDTQAGGHARSGGRYLK